ncbi:type III polyketide synthase, partial [bacterium]
QLVTDERNARIFRRLVQMGGIEHRYSFLGVDGNDPTGELDAEQIYRPGCFPSTAGRMRLFEKLAPKLAERAVEALDLGEDRSKITHLVVTSCTGMSAPGVDLQIAERCGLPGGIERTMVGFMGCYAAINAMKLARHIVRSEPESKVLMLNLELCTLHLKESTNLEQILSFFLFADGCAASLITAEPVGISMDRFHAILAPETADLITWNVGDSGFDMLLSGQVPGAIREALGPNIEGILNGGKVEEIDLWAVHPGGRSVLDAVQASLSLPPDALCASRDVLRRYGNMSSPSVVFVLKELMAGAKPDQRGCAMAFGPGLVAETMLFRTAA